MEERQSTTTDLETVGMRDRGSRRRLLEIWTCHSVGVGPFVRRSKATASVTRWPTRGFVTTLSRAVGVDSVAVPLSAGALNGGKA